MKKVAVFILMVVLLAAIAAPALGGGALEGISDAELLAELNRRNAIIELRATTENGKIPTRSGPSTAYTEPGTYDVLGKNIRIISRYDDHGGVCWLQCEVPVGSTFRRLYTGLKRFQPTPASFSIYDVPLEQPLNTLARVTVTSSAMYGPGGNYGTYGDLTLKKGQTVTIITFENGYAQVEWKGSDEWVRAWISESALRY